MRDRFNQKELWENLGLPVKEAIEVAMASRTCASPQAAVQPDRADVKTSGSGAPPWQKAFADMGASSSRRSIATALLDQDNRSPKTRAGVFVRTSLG